MTEEIADRVHVLAVVQAAVALLDTRRSIPEWVKADAEKVLTSLVESAVATIDEPEEEEEAP